MSDVRTNSHSWGNSMNTMPVKSEPCALRAWAEGMIYRTNAGTYPATQKKPCGPHPGALPMVANKYFYQNIFLFFKTENNL